MNCPYCGNSLPNGVDSCPSCGARQVVQNIPPNQYAPPPNQYAPPPNQFAPPPYGQPGFNQMMHPQINTWMVPSILSTLFCCLPLGIIGIIFAAKASSALSVGDYVSAQSNANTAKILFWISFISGFFISGFYFLAVLAEM